MLRITSFLALALCGSIAPLRGDARTRSICGVYDLDCGTHAEMQCESGGSCDAGFASYPFDEADQPFCEAGPMDRFCYDCCADGQVGGASGCNTGLVLSLPEDLTGGSIGPCGHLDAIANAQADPISFSIYVTTYTWVPPSPVALLNARGICSDASPVSFAGASRESWPDPATPSSDRSTIFVIHGRGSNCAEMNGLLDAAIYDRHQLAYCVQYDNSPASAVRVFPVAQDYTGEGPAGCAGGGCSFDTSHPVATETASPFTVEGVAAAVARAMSRVPTEGDLTLIPHSQGGFVARALLHRHYDELRWQGKTITRVVSLAHPYFGVLTDPSLMAGWACAQGSGSFKDCHVPRWLWGWQNWLDGAGATQAIDDLDFPQIEWSAIAGDGSLGNTSDALLDVLETNACIEVFGGVDNASVMGDDTVPILSSLGLDEHDFFAIESLDFDAAIEAPGCNHDATCLLAGGVAELGDGLLARAAARENHGTLTFAGAEQVAISDPAAVAALTLIGPLTIEAWVRPRATPSNTTLLSKGGEYRLEYASGSFHVTLNGLLGGDFVGFGSVPLDTWTHVAVTYAGGTMRGYVDGVLVHTENGGALVDDDPVHDELRIGGTEDGSLAPMVGGVDEVRIWARELTQAEVQAGLVGRAGAGDLSDLRAWWRFDEAGGDALVDSGPSGFDASLASFPDPPWRWGPAREDPAGTLYFDGVDDRVVIDDPAALAALEVSDALTVEAWVNPRGDEAGAVVSKEGEYQLSRLSDGTIGFTLASVSPGWTTRTTGIPLPEHTWTHLALVFDGSANEARIYRNGSLVFTEATVGPIGDFPSHADQDEVWFGGRQLDTVYYGGLIDEVRIWNVARSGPEIGAVLDPAAPGLVGAWRFGERQTDLVRDEVAGRNGTLGGGVATHRPSRALPEPGAGIALLAGGLLLGLLYRRER